MQSRRFDRSRFRYSIWDYNPTGSPQYKVIYDVHVYSLLHKERKGHGSEGSEGSEGREEVGSGLSTVLGTSATVTVLSRKITIVEHSPHILSTGRDQASDTLSATYISWIGSNRVDLWQPLHKTGRKQQKERTRWGSVIIQCVEDRGDINITMWDRDADGTTCLSSKSTPTVEMEQRHLVGVATVKYQTLYPPKGMIPRAVTLSTYLLSNKAIKWGNDGLLRFLGGFIDNIFPVVSLVWQWPRGWAPCESKLN